MADVSAFSTIPIANQDPMAAAKSAVDLGNALQNNKLIQQTITNSGIAGQRAQSDLNDSLNQQLGRASLAHALYGTQTPEAYKAEIDRQIAINPVLRSVGESWKSQIADDATPDQLKRQGIQHASALLDPSTQSQLGPNGQVSFFNDGQTQTPYQVPGALGRMAGAMPGQAGAGIQNQPSPSELLTPQSGVVTKDMATQLGLPDSAIGTSYTIPRGLSTPYRGIQGSGLTGAPAAPQSNALASPPSGANVVPLQNPPKGPAGRDGIPMNPPLPPGYVKGPDGRFYVTQVQPSGLPAKPGQVAQSQVPLPTPTQAPAPVQAVRNGVPPGATPTGLPTGQSQGIEQNQQAYRNAQVEASTLPLQNSQYIEAHNAIGDLKDSDFSTGIGSGRANKVRQLLVQLGAGPDMVKNVNSAATAEKYLAAAIAAKGPATDAGRDLLQHANPSVSMPPGATMPIIRQIVASNRAKQAVLATAPDSTGNGFLDHQTATSQKLNTPEGLKALAWDITPPSDRAKIISDLKAQGGNAMKNFEAALTIAHKNNLIGNQ